MYREVNHHSRSAIRQLTEADAGMTETGIIHQTPPTRLVSSHNTITSRYLIVIFPIVEENRIIYYDKY